MAVDGKGKITITTSHDQERNNIISIRDTGSGIKKEYLERITDPFFTTKAPGQGTGLGLSISSRILQDHNGSMSFQSEEGKGTEVIIVLPSMLT